MFVEVLWVGGVGIGGFFMFIVVGIVVVEDVEICMFNG